MAPTKARQATDASLEGVDDGSFHRREVVMQRVGTVVLVLFLAAGFFGAFGSGPLSRATATAADGATKIEYERMARAESATELRIVTSAVAAEGATLLRLSGPLVESIDIEKVVPQPLRVAAGPERVDFELAAVGSPPQRGGGGMPIEVVVHYRPQSIGPASATLRVGGRAEVHFRQFVFP